MTRIMPTLTALALAFATLAGCSGAPPAATSFTATITCGFGGGATRAVGELLRTTAMEMSCTIEASDPRVSGAQTGVLAIEEYPDGSARFWHTYRLTNDAGTWEGASSGLVAAGYTTHRIHVVATGTGAYAGLRLELDGVTTSDDSRNGYAATGTIGPDR